MEQLRCPKCGMETDKSVCPLCGEIIIKEASKSNFKFLSVIFPKQVIWVHIAWLFFIILMYVLDESNEKTVGLYIFIFIVMDIFWGIIADVIYYITKKFLPFISNKLNVAGGNRSFTPQRHYGCNVDKNPIPNDKKATQFDYDNMDGHDFEYFCANLLEENGYENVEVTKGSGDQGIDIIAYKEEIKYGIQCKCYASDIGNKAVQEAFAGKAFYGCHIAVVLTNRCFTKSAKELAEKNGVLLWDRNKLNSLIENYNDSNFNNSTYANTANKSFDDLIAKSKKWKIDTVFISTSNQCPVCSVYNRKIYSIYGWNKSYPILPDVLHNSRCPSCGRSIGMSMYQPGLNSKPR